MIGSSLPALLEDARSGDEPAFATMWREFHPPLLRYLRVVTVDPSIFGATPVATLPPDQAEAVMLRAIAGLDVGQVAAIMQKRPGTVRVLAHRGLRELARRLTEEEHRVVTP